MSAPHVCGATALLISGLLKNKIDYSPYSIKRALWNTATHLSHVDKFAQGNGLLNVEAAYENLVKYHDRSERDIRYIILQTFQKINQISLRFCFILTLDSQLALAPKMPREFICVAVF